ncbi:hypothetical protein CYMTET_4541 [Cymbomonas tetramitiformis]|uniref:Uncharacterized protein n=1 Tax=Cymbomonas tetramitiformis TaxID=36881 RepID=A0AAE0LK09_9CHLO|nr:hypothetical protein CYMTET_4541 [Cymbomonas tetramitiformis]
MQEVRYLKQTRTSEFNKSRSPYCIGRCFKNAADMIEFLADPENQLHLDRCDKRALFEIVRRDRLGVVTDKMRIISGSLKYVQRAYENSFSRRPYLCDGRPWRSEDLHDGVVPDIRFFEDASVTAFTPPTSVMQDMAIWRATCEGADRFHSVQEALREFGFDAVPTRSRCSMGVDFVVTDTLARVRRISSIAEAPDELTKRLDSRDELRLELVRVRPDVEGERRLVEVLKELQRFASTADLLLVVRCTQDSALKHSLLREFDVQRHSFLEDDYRVLSERSDPTCACDPRSNGGACAEQEDSAVASSVSRYDL